MINFSFIIPIYNVEIKDLKRCIDSICSQNSDYEVILINDGSSDESIANACIEYTKKNQNIKYYYQTNSGSAVARNLGLDKANGKYIFFADADDQYNEDFFKNIKNTDFYENDISFFDFSFFNLNKETLVKLDTSINYNKCKNGILSNILFSPHFFKQYLFGSIWSKCFNAEFLKKNNIKFRPELRKAQDRMFMLETIYYCEKMNYFPIHCYKYYTNNNSISHKYNRKMITYYFDLYNDINSFVDEKKIDKNVTKFLEYNIFFELMQLTTFHTLNSNNFIVKRKEYFALYNKFNLCKSKEKLKYKDFDSLKAKIKFFLFKNNMFVCLYFLFHQRQITEEKKYFYTK